MIALALAFSGSAAADAATVVGPGPIAAKPGPPATPASDVPWADRTETGAGPAAPASAAGAADAAAKALAGAPGAPVGPGDAAAVARSQAAGAVFERKCVSCHTIGDGERIGPDLVGVGRRRDARWLKRFLLDTDAMIDGGDAAAVALLAKYRGIRMPAQGLTPDEAEAMLGLLEDCTARGGCRGTFTKRTARDATPDEVLAGAALFSGTAALVRGGAPCMICHAMRGEDRGRGGSLGPDLTFAYARLGEAGLESALGTKLPAVMRDAYRERPLDSRDSLRLRGLLCQQARDLAPSEPRYELLYLGALGAAASFLAVAGWRARAQRDGGSR